VTMRTRGPIRACQKYQFPLVRGGPSV
jgi:hypothetical protein